MAGLASSALADPGAANKAATEARMARKIDLDMCQSPQGPPQGRASAPDTDTLREKTCGAIVGRLLSIDRRVRLSGAWPAPDRRRSRSRRAIWRLPAGAVLR